MVFVRIITTISFNFQNIDEEWSKYKVDHDRVYNGEEDAVRKQIFVTNWEAVKAHNKLYEGGKVSYSLGINQFSDRKPEELKHLTGGVRRPSN